MLDGALANAPLGATVTLSIEHGKGDSRVMQVPLASLYDAGKGRRLAYFRSADKVVWQPVRVLSVGDDIARVTGGVQPGEKIVALGVHLLHEGEAVRLAEQRDATQAGMTP